MSLKLYNTLSRKIEEFTPLNPPHVGMYTCGFTVYDYAHIGNLKKYIGDDLLRRTLVANDYQVKHVQNVTDVGHLTSDADEGDDKLEKGAKRTGQTVWEVAKFYENFFYNSLEKVNVIRPDIICRATEHIGEQIKLIEKLVEKGFTYQTEEAIYFNTSKFSSYGQLSGQKLEDKQTGGRQEVITDPTKKHPADFALWFFTVKHHAGHVMRWSSPWGEGFPGWHIECSAMSMEYLGDTLDIHTGGIDHIPVHHEDEIAQSEAATGKQFVRYWVHHEFLLIDGEKMGKSKNNFYTLDNLQEKGFEPLSFRYLILTAHYRDKINFTWESLQASQNALNHLRDAVREFVTDPSSKDYAPDEYYKDWFLNDINNDLNSPSAIAVMWQLIKDPNKSATQKATDIRLMDKVLGLNLEEYIGKPLEIPDKIEKLVAQREVTRKQKDFESSDKLRKEIKDLGFEVEDTPEGPKLKKA